jgi:hypothetical protein
MRYTFTFIATICSLICHAQLYIGSGETVKVGAANLLQVEMDLINNSSLDHITLTGVSAQSISGTGNIANLVVNKSAGTATVTGGRQSITDVLTMTAGTLAGGGRLTLKSDATKTARVAQVAVGANITGDVTVERYIPAARKWRMLTVPLTGSSNSSVFYNWQNNGTANGSTGVEIWGPGGTVSPSTGNGLQTGPNASMRSYSSSWSDVTNTKTLDLFSSTTNNAYALFVAGPFKNGGSTILVSQAAEVTTLSATGNLITGTHTKTLSASPAAGQYFLVGNPYAAPVDPRSISGTNLANTFYMWDASALSANRGLGIYVGFDRSQGEYSTVSGSSGFGNTPQPTHIQSGQAFFVKAILGGSTTDITFEEVDKGSAVGGGMFGPQQEPGAVGKLRLALQQDVSGITENADGAVAFFYANGNSEVDHMDGTKLMNGSENIFFRRNTSNLMFEHRPAISTKDTLFVRMSNMKQSPYRLAIEGANLAAGKTDALLIDRYTKKETSVDLATLQGYDFSVTSDSASTGDRFMVLFSKAASPVVVTPEQPASTKKLTLYPNPVRGKLQLSVNLNESGPYSVQVFNMAGSEVWRQSGIAEGTRIVDINTSALGAGVYSLVLTNARGGMIVEKFVKE